MGQNVNAQKDQDSEYVNAITRYKLELNINESKKINHNFRVVNGEIFFFLFRCIIIPNDLFRNF